jgi:hypothetical protein
MAAPARLLLLDANAIIYAHETACWDALCSRCSVTVPSIIVRWELLPYLDAATGVPSQIDLRPLVGNGITEAEGTEMQLANVSVALRGRISLHPGEHEALALMLSGSLPTHSFCTSDAAAIKAAVMLGLSARLVSLEEVLTSIGYSRKLPLQHTRDFLKRCAAQGFELKLRFGM